MYHIIALSHPNYFFLNCNIKGGIERSIDATGRQKYCYYIRIATIRKENHLLCGEIIHLIQLYSSSHGINISIYLAGKNSHFIQFFLRFLIFFEFFFNYFHFLAKKHIYIPVLPKSLLSFVCAPMPFVVGILKSELDEVLRQPMDEVLIIDVDNNYFIRTPVPEDETFDLDMVPVTYVNQLRKMLRNATRTAKSFFFLFFSSTDFFY